MSGIYRIRNLRNGKSYVGQAALTFEKRFKEHRHYLRYGKHHSKYLQRSWDQHGEQAFAFEVIEEILRGQKTVEEFKKALSEREQFYMDALQAADPMFGYNVSPRAGTQYGYQHSEESKRKMREAGRGRKLPDEWRQSIAEAIKAKGIKRSRSERDRLSARRAQLQKDDVFNVLDMYEEGVPQESIAQRFGISLPAINRIIRGLSYRKWGEEWCQARGMDSLPNRTRANVRYTKDEIFEILDRDRKGELRQVIATVYDASPSHITQICQGKFYPKWYEEWHRLREIESSEKGKRKIKKLSENDVRSIRNDLELGIKQRDIAKKYSVSPSTICDIKEGRTHTSARRKRIP